MIECYQNTRHKQNVLALGEADVQFFGKNLCIKMSISLGHISTNCLKGEGF